MLFPDKQMTIDPVSWPYQRTTQLKVRSGIIPNYWSSLTSTRVGAVWPEQMVSKLYSIMEKLDYDLMVQMHTSCIKIWNPTMSTIASSSLISVDNSKFYCFHDYDEVYRFTADIFRLYGNSFIGICKVTTDFLTNLPVKNGEKGFAFSEVELLIVLYNVIYFCLSYLGEIYQVQIPGIDIVLKYLRAKLRSS